MFVLYNGSKRLSYGKIERPYYLIYNKEKSCEHTNCLERIRPHQRLDTSTACVKPDQTDHSHDSEGERDTVLLETTVRPDTKDPYINPDAAPTLPEDE